MSICGRKPRGVEVFLFLTLGLRRDDRSGKAFWAAPEGREHVARRSKRRRRGDPGRGGSRNLFKPKTSFGIKAHRVAIPPKKRRGRHRLLPAPHNKAEKKCFDCQRARHARRKDLSIRALPNGAQDRLARRLRQAVNSFFQHSSFLKPAHCNQKTFSSGNRVNGGAKRPFAISRQFLERKCAENLVFNLDAAREASASSSLGAIRASNRRVRSARAL